MNRGSDNPGVNAVSRRINAPPQWLTRLADYWTLTKPEVNFLVLVSTLVGFYLASRGPLDFWGCCIRCWAPCSWPAAPGR